MTAPSSQQPVQPVQPVQPAGVAPMPRDGGGDVTQAQGRLDAVGAAHGRPGQIRNPVVVLLLGYITFGIYGMYMHYTLNAEMKEFDRAVQVSPGIAVLALFFPIANIITGLNTSKRVRQIQAAAGQASTCSGGLTFLCMLVGASFAYQQSQLNAVWSRTA